MSAETTQALEAAIRAQITDENPGAVVIEWILLTSSIEPGGKPGDRLNTYEDGDQPSHHATGLLERAIGRIEQEALAE